jgi:diacylglycerol kinase (ATP)
LLNAGRIQHARYSLPLASMRILVVFNPIAGAGRAARAAWQVEEALRHRGHEVRRLPSQTKPVATWLDEAADESELLVVIGGDGAVRQASASAMRTGVPLYHYPSGTENLFSREFGMVASPEALVRAIEQARARPVDVGEANGETFLLMASVGFDAEVVHDLAARRTGAISHLSYLGPVARQLRGWAPPRLTTRADGVAMSTAESGTIVVANSPQYALRMNPAWRARVDDGLLDALFFPARSSAGVLSWIVQSVLGMQTSSPRLVYRTAATVVIESDIPFRFQLDGDPPTDRTAVTRLDVRVRPQALRLLIPTV